MPKAARLSKKVICIVRVSTEEQDPERQLRVIPRLLRKFDLEQEGEVVQLKVSGTAVFRNEAYREVMKKLNRSEIIGLLIPSIDRWFRYEKLSHIAEYVKPFEEMVEGKTSKLIYSNVGPLDMSNRDDQDKLVAAIQFASRERETITGRLTEGKDIGREDPEVKIDDLPDFVEFIPFKKGENRGSFRYNDFARDSVLPLCTRFLAGEPLFALAIDLGFGPKCKSPAEKVQHARSTLKNLWLIGVKHRTRHIRDKIWDEEKNGFRLRGLVEHENQFRVPTNLAKTPLITPDMFQAIQNKMAVRKTEYGMRKKIVNEFLASPLFHCRKCGSQMYGRRGSHGKPDTYTCSKRYRFQTCDEPIYRRVELDHEVGIKLMFLLQNKQLINDKIKEALNTEHRAEAQAAVERKKRIVADLETKANRIRKHMRDSDDSQLAIDLKELNREIATARNDVAAAQESVSDVPVIDHAALRRQVTQDMLAFPKKSHTEQKALLAKYVKNITAGNFVTGDEDEGDEAAGPEYDVDFTFKFDLPTMGTVSQVGTKHRTKSASPYSVSSMRSSCARCRSSIRNS